MAGLHTHLPCPTASGTLLGMQVPMMGVQGRPLAVVDTSSQVSGVSSLQSPKRGENRSHSHSVQLGDCSLNLRVRADCPLTAGVTGSTV